MASVLDILKPSVVTGLMNEVKTPYDRFQEFFGLSPKGPACVTSETRSVSVDLVNDDRTVSTFTAPGGDAVVIAPMVIGTRQVTAPRTFERMDLSFERLNNIRALGKGASELDRSGLTYLKQQAGHMLRRTRRFREFLIWGMLRGSCQFLISGNEWIPVITGGTVTLDWQVASGHKNQIGGIIGTSWDNVAAPILTDLGDINAKAEEDCGLPITHAWCNSSRWMKILNNTEVRNLGGSANSPFELFNAVQKAFPNYGGEGTSVEGRLNEHVGVLKGYPSLLWHITDRGLKLNGTFTKYLGDDEILFHPDPDMSGSWYDGVEILESTNQGTNVAPTPVYGYGAWIKHPVDSDTPKYLLYDLDNFFPRLNPNAVFFADVTP